MNDVSVTSNSNESATTKEVWRDHQPAMRVKHFDCVRNVRMTEEDDQRYEEIRQALQHENGYSVSFGLLMKRAMQVYGWHLATHLEEERQVIKNIGKNLNKTKKKAVVQPCSSN